MDRGRGAFPVSGYTPVFSTVFDGTLHGRWPQTGVWLALLAMADRHGYVDRSPPAIASDIGIDVPALMACIEEFCAPDPMSRTRDCDGRRLELIDPERPWGWRIINHGKYREKARLVSKASDEVASGRNAERMKHRRATADDRRIPPPTDPSDSDSDSDKKLRSDSGSTLSASESDRAPSDALFAQRTRKSEQVRKLASAAVKRMPR